MKKSLQEIKVDLESIAIPKVNSMVNLLPDILDIAVSSGMMPPALQKGLPLGPAGMDLKKALSIVDKINNIRMRNAIEKLAEVEEDINALDVDVDLSEHERQNELPYVKAKIDVSRKIIKKRLDNQIA